MSSKILLRYCTHLGNRRGRKNESADVATRDSDVARQAKRLSGKAAIVTGAARGIGRAAAIALAHGGADVMGVDIGWLRSGAYRPAAMSTLQGHVPVLRRMMVITSPNPWKNGAGSRAGMCGTWDAVPFSSKLPSAVISYPHSVRDPLLFRAGSIPRGLRR